MQSRVTEPPYRPADKTRMADRINVALPARLMWKDQRGTTRFTTVTTRNVSEFGAFVECSTPVSLPLYRPDIMVTGKGISGGMYPIAAVLATDAASGWLNEDGFGHISTFGGAELGCLAALKTLEICSREETRSLVHYISDFVGRSQR